MITVRFFGQMSLDHNTNRLEFGESLFSRGDVTLKDVFSAILSSCPDMTNQQLNQSVLFLNKQQLSGGRRLSQKITDGDELTFLSPAGGG